MRQTAYDDRSVDAHTLLDVLVADLEITPSLTGLCAGFEAGRWRALELARHLFEWLPEFALTTSEYHAFNRTTTASTSPEPRVPSTSLTA